MRQAEVRGAGGRLGAHRPQGPSVGPWRPVPGSQTRHMIKPFERKTCPIFILRFARPARLGDCEHRIPREGLSERVSPPIRPAPVCERRLGVGRAGRLVTAAPRRPAAPRQRPADRRGQTKAEKFFFVFHSSAPNRAARPAKRKEGRRKEKKPSPQHPQITSTVCIFW